MRQLSYVHLMLIHQLHALDKCLNLFPEYKHFYQHCKSCSRAQMCDIIMISLLVTFLQLHDDYSSHDTQMRSMIDKYTFPNTLHTFTALQLLILGTFSTLIPLSFTNYACHNFQLFIK